MKRNLLNLPIFVATALLLIVAACTNKNEAEKETVSAGSGMPNPYEKAKIETQIFKVDSIEGNGTRGWGYNILIDGRLLHSPTQYPGSNG